MDCWLIQDSKFNIQNLLVFVGQMGLLGHII